MRQLLLFFAVGSMFLVIGPGIRAQKKTDKEIQKENEKKLEEMKKLHEEMKKKYENLNEIAGKKVEEWALEIKSTDRSKSETAIHTILMFPPAKAFRAVPALLAELEKHSSAYPIDTAIRVNATIAVGIILDQHTGYKEADPKHVKEAVRLLMGTGQSRGLNDTQSIVRFRAAQALGRIGPRAKLALPQLSSTAGDPNTFETRQAAVMAIAQIAYGEKGKPPLSKEVVGALERRLKDSAHVVKIAAIQALGTLALQADNNQRQGMVTALASAAAYDKDPSVRIWAHLAVMGVSGKVDNNHLEPIAKMLKNKNTAVRTQAAQALGRMGPVAKGMIKYLVAALNDPEPEVVYWVIDALAGLKSDGKLAVPALKKIKDSKDQPEVLQHAAQAAIDVIEGRITTKEKTPDSKSKSLDK